VPLIDRRELVVRWTEHQLGTVVARSRPIEPRVRCKRGSDEHPTVDARVDNAERYEGAEAVADQHQGSVVGIGCRLVERRRNVEPFALALAVCALTITYASKVEPHGRQPGRLRSTTHCSNDRVVHIATVQRMWVAHHDCAPPVFGHAQFAPKSEAIDGLRQHGFRQHRFARYRSRAMTDGKLPIKMLNDRILVKLSKDDGERRTTGGILIPATAQMSKRLVWAEVVAIGPVVRSAEIGDRVLFSPDDRYEVEVQGEDLIMLRERDLHAVAGTRIEGGTGLYL
jgi:chaperonin GroES